MNVFLPILNSFAPKTSHVDPHVEIITDQIIARNEMHITVQKWYGPQKRKVSTESKRKEEDRSENKKNRNFQSIIPNSRWL